MTQSGIYHGTVWHSRDLPTAHAFRYPLIYFVIDLDAIAELENLRPWFGVNKRAWFSWRDADHGDGSGKPYRLFLDNLLRARGWTSLPVTYLAMTLPRTLGYCFNPLTVVHGLDATGNRIVTVYEVNNTIGKRTHYVLDEENSHCEKSLPVSPFFEARGDYEFEASVPGEKLDLRIVYRDSSGSSLHTGFSGRRTPLDARHLKHFVARFPFLALRVIAAIHYQALRLWLKGIRFIGLDDARSDNASNSSIQKTT